MDYDRIHNELIEYCSKTTPMMRLVERDPDDLRLFSGAKIYTENHHITPKSLGGLCDQNNLVRLLPEEHLFIHQLRYKAYDNRIDMIAVRMILNGFNNKTFLANEKLIINKKILQIYSWMKQSSAEFRKKHGWQTQKGRTKISEARKGTMPVKDSKTGVMIGSVPIDHPKVISKEWIHHCTGVSREKTEIEIERYKKSKGSGNPNYSGYTDQDIVDRAMIYYNERGKWVAKEWNAICKEERYPQSMSSRFDQKGYKGFQSALEKANNGPLVKLKHSDKEYRDKLSAVNKNKRWYTNIKTKETTRVVPDKNNTYGIYENTNKFRRGRK